MLLSGRPAVLLFRYALKISAATENGADGVTDEAEPMRLNPLSVYTSNTLYTADGLCLCNNVIATLCTGTPPGVFPSHRPLWAWP